MTLVCQFDLSFTFYENYHGVPRQSCDNFTFEQGVEPVTSTQCLRDIVEVLGAILINGAILIILVICV